MTIEPASEHQFRAEVSRRARAFDLKALLDLLGAYGYGREAVRFRGHHDGSPSSFVERVEFFDGPRYALITVNLGLLGDDALLPAYFVQEAERSGTLDTLHDFVSFFENGLIRNYADAVWPEDDKLVYEDYPLLRDALIGVTGFSSLASMTWLVQLLFPDVPTRVQRSTFPADLKGLGLRTGASLLDGATVLGDVYSLDMQGFLIDLTVGEETDLRGRSFATVLQGRVVNRLLPLLRPFNIPVCVRLHISTHESWSHLDEETTQQDSLGYSRIRGNADDGATVVLWRGLAPSRGPT